MDVRGALTATLGVPIATAERPDAQGSVGFFFHEGRDMQGNVSDRVLAVTCHHVLFETTKTHNVKYELKGAGAPPKYVRLHGIRWFQKFLDDIKHRFNRHAIMVNIHEREIRKLEVKEKSQDPEVVVVEEEEEEELAKTHRTLADENKAIDDLEKFYINVTKDWSDSEHRNIGTIDYLSGMRSLLRTGVRSRSTRLSGKRYSRATFWIWVRLDLSFSHLPRLTRSILFRNRDSCRQPCSHDVPSQRQ